MTPWNKNYYISGPEGKWGGRDHGVKNVFIVLIIFNVDNFYESHDFFISASLSIDETLSVVASYEYIPPNKYSSFSLSSHKRVFTFVLGLKRLPTE